MLSTICSIRKFAVKNTYIGNWLSKAIYMGYILSETFLQITLLNETCII